MFYQFTLTTGEIRLVNLRDISTVAPLENGNSDISLTNGVICTVRMDFNSVAALLKKL